MLRTASFPIEVDEAKCFSLMEKCAEIFNAHVDWAFENKTYSKAKAHKALYATLVTKFNDVPTGLIQSVRDTALEAVKGTKFKSKPVKRPHGAIRFDKRTATLRMHKLTFSCIGPRQKTVIPIYDYIKPLLAWEFKGMTLVYERNQFWAKCVFENPDPPQLDPKVVIGIDRGLSHMAVLSNGKFFSSKKANAGQRRYLHNRKTAQVKGTPSARKRLKRMGSREQRFNRDVNHCTTKAIVHGDGETFVLENLQGIRSRRRMGRKMNKRLASWPFYQFDLFLTYKAQALGKSVVYVDARYTSQRCSCCHHTARNNRSGAVFHCKKCGHKMHADLNAAINIRERYLLSLLQGDLAGEQGAVNHPGITEAWPITMPQIPSDATISASASVRESVASHGPRARGS